MSDPRPIVLDLFSGTGSATQPFVECGRHRVIRIDIAGKPDIRADVRHLPLGDAPLQFIWASPPCQGFSVAGIPHHWKGYRPDATAKMAIVLEQAAFRFIASHPEAKYVVENPSGLMRKYALGYTEQVFYCSYGATFKKPTDLWHNLPVRFALPCAPHTPSSRGSHDPYSIQGMRDPAKRAMIPRHLPEAVHRAVCDFALAPKEGK